MLQSALKRGGRQRNIADRARQIRAALRSEQLTAPPQVTAAFAATTRATVGIITELNRQITELETKLAEHFETHPDADIYLSLPGLGVILGARVLGEFRDDPTDAPDPKSPQKQPRNLTPDRRVGQETCCAGPPRAQQPPL